MKSLDPTRPDLAFVPADTPVFAGIIARIEADNALPPQRRRDLASGLRRVSQALGRPPEDVPADPKWLQPRLARIAPAALGISAKTWQNALSDARMAMAHVGIVRRRNRRIEDLSPDWAGLWRRVLDHGRQDLPLALCRMVHFLDRRGVRPSEVGPADAQAYLEAIEADEISKSPQVAWRLAINGWNRAARLIPNWPGAPLPLPRRQVVHLLPEDDLPSGFLTDLDRVLARLSTPDPFAEDGPAKALRPATTDAYRRQLKRLASILISDGVPPERLGSVAALCDPALAERGLRIMVARRGNRSSRLIAETAGLLRNLSRKLALDDATREGCASLAWRLALPAQKGMTTRNRDRLRVLQDDRMLTRLLDLPGRLSQQAMSRNTPHAVALAREDGLAIGLLLACPIRVGNLSALQLDRHLQRPGDGRMFLVLAEDEVKNARPVEFEIPGDLVRMIDRHLARRAPTLCPPDTPWLFPRRDGTGPVHPNRLSARLQKRIRDETGLVMNAHLFRHMAAMIWLDAHPGAYEAARRLLGHSDASHTINLYSGLEAGRAVAAYAKVLDGKRRDGTRRDAIPRAGA